MKKVFLILITAISLTPAITGCSDANQDGNDGFRESMEESGKDNITPEDMGDSTDMEAIPTDSM